MTAILPAYLLPSSPNPDVQRYGLFKVANGPFDMPVPQAAEGGVQYQTPLCTLPYGYDVTCPPGSLTLTDQLGLVVGTPFMVVSDTLCGTLGHTEAEWQDYVTQRLYAGEQAAVEMIFSNQANGQSPGLANNTNVTNLGTASSISGGIDALESWLYARYGPAGVLHIPISANSAVYSDFHILRDTDGILYTPMGTKVSFGNYSGNGPTGTAPATGHTTFYITGQVSIWRQAQPFVSPYGASIDKVTNQIRMFAERAYVMAFDCYSASIDVTIAGEP